MLVLAPILGADLQPEQYGYRAERSAREAVATSASSLWAGLVREEPAGPGRPGLVSVPPDASQDLYRSERLPVLVLNCPASTPIF